MSVMRKKSRQMIREWLVSKEGREHVRQLRERMSEDAAEVRKLLSDLKPQNTDRK